ncbi:MAG: cryptochrome/photolyase family protein, partial [Methylobacterium sp.]|nr:cryptochrome/photolyase family protein [Methylobacterium sp.]
VLGDQLTHDNPALREFDPQQDRILMIEARGEANAVWNHKARIALFLSAMRHFAEELRARGLPLVYLRLGEHDFPTLEAGWRHYIAHWQPQKIIVCEPGSYRIQQSLQELARTCEVALALRDDTHFLCSRADFARWAGKGKTLRMEFFYRWMRRQHGVLMEGDGPAGGAWNFDHDNRESFGKAGPQGIAAPLRFAPDAITRDVLGAVEHHFADHPGSLEQFGWPVTRADALAALQDFVTQRLRSFGPHQDAMWNEQPFLSHSLLAPALNLKLLDPREVIAAAGQAWHEHDLPLASVEGFIRQILGWREFIRGVYWLEMPALEAANHFGHRRDLPRWFWTGETGMECQRQAITQTLRYGYAHHIQRLMVTGLFGLLAEIDPKQVSDWYLAVYVDAVEWVELPNVMGMALYADGGRFTSKPYVASGAYIQRMSNYCDGCRYDPKIRTGPRACPVTTLYWHFLDRHAAELSANPRTALMAKNLQRLPPEQRAAIRQQAATLLDALDQL